ncbi:hypothetical protein ACWPKS_03615 [Coraliomargarita sp. W4R72]
MQQKKYHIYGEQIPNTATLSLLQFDLKTCSEYLGATYSKTMRSAVVDDALLPSAACPTGVPNSQTKAS